jgi:GNAT superfamily N-acetyltransferase
MTKLAFDDVEIVIRMMDERYIVNDCPQEPTYVDVLRGRNSTWCGAMGVSGRPIREVTAAARQKYGNCAVLAWHGEVVVGIMTFFPVRDLYERQAMGWEMMEPDLDTGTLAIASCVLCSLGGHRYRRRGIGRAMAQEAVGWARAQGYRRVGVYQVPSGLTTIHWQDACRPPLPFWRKLGFAVAGTAESGRRWDEVKAEFLTEMEQAEPKDAWKREVFPRHIREVESSPRSYGDIDRRYALVRAFDPSQGSV